MFQLALLSGISWSAVHAILAACTLFGGSAFWVIWRLHIRLRTLEEGGDERRDTLFGHDNNPLNVGLTREVASLKDEVASIQEENEQASIERVELRERLEQLDTKMDLLLKKMDED